MSTGLLIGALGMIPGQARAATADDCIDEPTSDGKSRLPTPQAGASLGMLLYMAGDAGNFEWLGDLDLHVPVLHYDFGCDREPRGPPTSNRLAVGLGGDLALGAFPRLFWEARPYLRVEFGHEHQTATAYGASLAVGPLFNPDTLGVAGSATITLFVFEATLRAGYLIQAKGVEGGLFLGIHDPWAYLP